MSNNEEGMKWICSNISLNNKHIIEYDNSDVNIDTPELAYVFGILWGDGYLTNNSNKYFYAYLGMVSEDFQDIKLLFDGWTVKTRKRSPERKEITEAYRFDRNLGLFMLKNRYAVKSKESPSSILDNIPNNLKHYFWRGYSDADGNFYYNRKYECYQYSLAGSFEQDWVDMESLCNSLYISYRKERRIQGTCNTKSSVIRIANRKDIVKLGDYLYSGKLFGLTRKYDTYIIMKNHTSLTKQRELEQIEQIKNVITEHGETISKQQISEITGIKLQRVYALFRRINDDLRKS